jgi:hypothetical protein
MACPRRARPNDGEAGAADGTRAIVRRRGAASGGGLDGINEMPMSVQRESLVDCSFGPRRARETRRWWIRYRNKFGRTALAIPYARDARSKTSCQSNVTTKTHRRTRKEDSSHMASRYRVAAAPVAFETCVIDRRPGKSFRRPELPSPVSTRRRPQMIKYRYEARIYRSVVKVKIRPELLVTAAYSTPSCGIRLRIFTDKQSWK